MQKKTHIKNILTFDVEEYFQVENFKNLVRVDDWPKFESRVEKQIQGLLDMLDAHEVRATFFVLGWVAQRVPQVVRTIASRGHEIASHGWAHQLVFSQLPEEFRQDVRNSKRLLEDISGQAVVGYRAPTFSITTASIWAFEILRQEGFLYDSSVFPARRDTGGVPDARRFAGKIKLSDGCLYEYPVSTARVCGRNIAFSGGGYFRLFPYALVRFCMRELNAHGIPAMTYFHPWEFDPQQPRIKAGPIKTFRHYVNIHRNAAKLERLLRDFSFGPARDALKDKES